MQEIFSNNEVVLIKSTQAKATVVSGASYNGIGTLYYLIEVENQGIHHLAPSSELERILP